MRRQGRASACRRSRRSRTNGSCRPHNPSTRDQQTRRQRRHSAATAMPAAATAWAGIADPSTDSRGTRVRNPIHPSADWRVSGSRAGGEAFRRPPSIDRHTARTESRRRRWRTRVTAVCLMRQRMFRGELATHTARHLRHDTARDLQCSIERAQHGQESSHHVQRQEPRMNACHERRLQAQQVLFMGNLMTGAQNDGSRNDEDGAKDNDDQEAQRAINKSSAAATGDADAWGDQRPRRVVPPKRDPQPIVPTPYRGCKTCRPCSQTRPRR